VPNYNGKHLLIDNQEAVDADGDIGMAAGDTSGVVLVVEVCEDTVMEEASDEVEMKVDMDVDGMDDMGMEID